VALSARDRRIIDCAHRKLNGACVNFDDALRALRDAVEEHIPDGRVYLIGTLSGSPVIGSLISGVGIVDTGNDVSLVRVTRHGGATRLGGFAP
jgi:hypothetical protein